LPEAPRPDNEEQRLKALRNTGLLETPREERFDRIARIAKRIFDMPIVLITLVDANRQWFLCNYGMGDVSETPRSVSFCAYAILKNEMLLIEDATKDSRFADNPVVTGKPGIRFYAGQPITDQEGFSLGTLCLIDTKPRKMPVEDLIALRDLSKWVEYEIRKKAERR